MRRYAVLVIAGLLLAGCGGAGTINRARLEREIHTWAVKQDASPNVRVRCPGDIPATPGSTFHCLVSAGGQSVRVTVTVENAKGYVTWVVG